VYTWSIRVEVARSSKPNICVEYQRIYSNASIMSLGQEELTMRRTVSRMFSLSRKYVETSYEDIFFFCDGG
jgi:hypothetical protein